MTTVPDFLPVLSAGGHTSPEQGACFMEYASFLAGERFSDHPACAHPVLADLARSVNDRLADGERWRIAHLIPAVIGTVDTREDETQRGILSVRLAVWCARQVLDLATGVVRASAKDAIEAAEAWADCPCRGHASAASNYAVFGSDCNAANVAYDVARAVRAFTEEYALDAVVGAAEATADADRLVSLLEGAFAEHARLTGRTQPEPLDEDTARRLRGLVAP